jgi:SsrA-binding protein
MGRANAYFYPIMAKEPQNKNYKVIAENRRARYDYAIEDDIECGIILMGSEVKAMRVGQTNIAESYAMVENGELWLTNAYIAKYDPARQFGHEERRKRKLLVRGKELARLWSATQREGMIATAKGKQNHDKRATEAKRDWDRQKARVMREHG